MQKILAVIAVLLIIALIVSVPAYLKDLRRVQEKQAALTTNIIDTSIVPVQYYRTGKDAPVLISHGITGGFDQGLGLAALYIGGEHDLIAVSRLGYLGTPLPENATPDVQADVYRDLLNELNIDKAYIFGNSAGTTSAVKFALHYPERCLGLILVSAAVPSNVIMPPKFIMQAVFGSDIFFWSIVRMAGYNMLPAAGVPKAIIKKLSKEQKDILLKDTIMSGFPISSRTKGVINDMYVSNPDINNNYPFEEIKVPVLMIHAQDDPLCPYEGAKGMAEKIPDIKFVSIEKGGHLLLGSEDIVKQKTAEFIK